MHKKMSLVFACLLLLCSLLAAQTDVYQMGKARVHGHWVWTVTMSGDVANLETMTVSTNFFTNDSNQRVLTYSTNYPAELVTNENGSKLIFNFTRPTSPLQITADADVEVDFNHWQIKEAVPYQPRSGLEDTELTRPDAAIAGTAQQLKGSSGDTMEIMVNAVNWLQDNVEYDSSFSDVNLTAVQVYQGKKGTCDEFSHLMIAFANALSIRTRFVAGYVYSGQKWEPHAWVEVYSDKYGWVPFDPTFNEAVYLNALHVKTSAKRDQSEVLEEVRGTGVGSVQFSINKDVNLSIVSVENFPVNFNASVETEKIDEQTELLRILVNNPNNYCQFVPLEIVSSDGVVIENQKQLVYLAPGESKTIETRATLPALQTGYQYSFPLEIKTRGQTVATSIERSVPANNTILPTNETTDKNKNQGCMAGLILGVVLAAMLFLRPY